jgi:hypothetical protein
MSVFQSFRETLKQRLQALLWRNLASDVETDAILQDVANLDRIEKRARQYEAEDKPHLAEMLRQRAAKLDANAPGGSITLAVRNLCGTPESVPLLPDDNGRNDKHPENGKAALPSPRRSRRRRSETVDEARED